MTEWTMDGGLYIFDCDIASSSSLYYNINRFFFLYPIYYSLPYRV
jgi:hypothetical protein